MSELPPAAASPSPNGPPDSPPSHPAPESRTISLAELFFGFAQAGLSGFGGVMPFARRMIIEERRWMTEAEFTEVLSLGQFLPGPNIGNVSILIGARYHGVAGALAAFFGLMFPPFLISIGLGALYARYGHEPAVRHVFIGITAAASGLLLGTACKLARPLLRRPVAMAFLLLAFGAIAFLRLPLLGVLAVLAPFSTLVSWPRKPPDRKPSDRKPLDPAPAAPQPQAPAP